MAIVYQHRRLDTEEVFYIGIGTTKRRAYSNYKRSKYWHSIVNKAGYTVELLHENIHWEQACKIEQDLIKQYGRKDLGLGNLINLTDGGDGRFGCIVSEETKNKMSRSHKGLNTWSKDKKRPKELVDKITESIREYWRYNKKEPLTEETKEKIRQSLIGKPGTWIGKKHTSDSIQKMKQSHGTGVNNKNYGRTNTEETKKKMSIAAKNRPQVTCPYCNKQGQKSTMQQWHFDNCKLKPTI